jgi:hypothetical protein
MIIVSAKVWPYGNSERSYEILHSTITNVGAMEGRDHYTAHVLARPAVDRKLAGYEADVEVLGHKYENGFAPLLMAVLGAAHQGKSDPITGGLYLPPARLCARVDLHRVEAFLTSRGCGD